MKSNVALEEGEAVWIRCLLGDRCEKSFWQKESIFGLLWIWKKHMIGRACGMLYNCMGKVID